MVAALDRYIDCRRVCEIHQGDPDLVKQYEALMIVHALDFARMAADRFSTEGIKVKFYD